MERRYGFGCWSQCARSGTSSLLFWYLFRLFDMTQVALPAWLKISCTVLGGFGHAVVPNETVDLLFREKSFEIRAGDRTSEEIFYLELVELEISGPGTVARGGGFIGGGFGIGGAIEGIAIAGILNALTTRYKVHTFLTLVTHMGEIHLHHGGMEPAALRIALAEVFVILRRQDVGWMHARRAVLEEQRASMHESEHELLVSRLLRPRHHQSLDERSGRCPNCDAIIPLISAACPRCDARFGQGASWSVTPI